MLKSVVLFSLWAYSFKKQNFAQGPSMPRMDYFHELCGGAVTPVTPSGLCWSSEGAQPCCAEGFLVCLLQMGLWDAGHESWENTQLLSCSSDLPSTSIIHSTLLNEQSCWMPLTTVSVCLAVRACLSLCSSHWELCSCTEAEKSWKQRSLVGFPIMAVVVATHSPALVLLGGICTRVCGFRGAPGSKASVCAQRTTWNIVYLCSG